jgi:hypothetical protein
MKVRVKDVRTPEDWTKTSFTYRIIHDLTKFPHYWKLGQFRIEVHPECHNIIKSFHCITLQSLSDRRCIFAGLVN